jgi:hypothetical protein
MLLAERGKYRSQHGAGVNQCQSFGHIFISRFDAYQVRGTAIYSFHPK